jgi:hypothetical protein
VLLPSSRKLILELDGHLRHIVAICVAGPLDLAIPLVGGEDERAILLVPQNLQFGYEPIVVTRDWVYDNLFDIVSKQQPSEIGRYECIVSADGDSSPGVVIDGRSLSRASMLYEAGR